ncbi:MAG: hypothetical protein JNL66_02450 [Alphaproteobacteria bacterium]|nr:hypothetical protein [Alphaproteobacteria bacterium]
MIDLALSRSGDAAVLPVGAYGVRRVRLSLQDIATIDPRLARVHSDWTQRRKAGGLPGWSGADLEDLRPSVDRLQVVEPVEARPHAGRFQSVIDVLGEQSHYDPYSGFMDLSLDCPTSDSSVRGLIEDYTNVVFFGSPALHRIEVATDTASRRFHRLILPLAADGRRVSLLQVCLNAAQD